MMKTYEVLAWSSVAWYDKAFFFEIEASDLADAQRKVGELVSSQEWAWRELLIERIEDKAEREARCA